MPVLTFFSAGGGGAAPTTTTVATSAPLQPQTAGDWLKRAADVDRAVFGRLDTLSRLPLTAGQRSLVDTLTRRYIARQQRMRQEPGVLQQAWEGVSNWWGGLLRSVGMSGPRVAVGAIPLLPIVIVGALAIGAGSLALWQSLTREAETDLLAASQLYAQVSAQLPPEARGQLDRLITTVDRAASPGLLGQLQGLLPSVVLWGAIGLGGYYLFTRIGKN